VLKYDLAFSENSFDNLYPAYIRGLAYLQMRYGRLAAAEFQKLFDHPGIVGTRVTGHGPFATSQGAENDG